MALLLVTRKTGKQKKVELHPSFKLKTKYNQAELPFP